MDQFNESASLKKKTGEEDIASSMPNLMPGMASDEKSLREREEKREAWTNLIVFFIAVLATLPFLFFGRTIFRTDSSDHFLKNLPLADFQSLQPVLGEEELPTSADFMHKTLFVILWGPWDEKSCQVLQELTPSLKEELQKNKNFQLIPIAYFPETKMPKNWYEMDPLEKEQLLERKKFEHEQLEEDVKRVFKRDGFKFSSVWWDPVGRFRQDLIDIAQQESLEVRRKIDGLGFPTILHVEKGIIQNVWTSASGKDWDEIQEVLLLLESSDAGEENSLTDEESSENAQEQVETDAEAKVKPQALKEKKNAHPKTLKEEKSPNEKEKNQKEKTASETDFEDEADSETESDGETDSETESDGETESETDSETEAEDLENETEKGTDTDSEFEETA